MVGHAWRGRKESCGRTPHEETGSRAPRRSFRRLRRLVANGRFTWFCSLRGYLVAVSRECLAEPRKRTAPCRADVAATAGQFRLRGISRQGVSRLRPGENCKSDDKCRRRNYSQSICEGRYWFQLVLAVDHKRSPPFMASASVTASSKALHPRPASLATCARCPCGSRYRSSHRCPGRWSACTRRAGSGA
jgi:hypothetical protein